MRRKSTYPGHDLYVEMPTHGGHVRDAQRRLNALRDDRRYDEAKPPKLKVDGIYGPKTATAVEIFQHHHKLTPNGIVGPGTWAKLFGERRGHAALRVHAFRIMLNLLGTLEQGGNNTGPMVDKIIRANGGVIGESWCGDFVAYCYRRAGSTRVQRAWAAVRLILASLGARHATSNPKTGDIVRYDFEGPGSLSHTGLFGWWCDEHGHLKPKAEATHICAGEGNTGPTGAVSDSANGNDGVRLKIRSRALIHDFIRVGG